jgi:hypothetical protein
VQEGEDFFIVGADSVRKKLGNNAEWKIARNKMMVDTPIKHGIYIYIAYNNKNHTYPQTLSILGDDKCTEFVKNMPYGTESARRSVLYIAELTDVPGGAVFTDKNPDGIQATGHDESYLFYI